MSDAALPHPIHPVTLHCFNPWHDEALASASPHYQPPLAACRLAADLALLPAWWAAPGDAVAVLTNTNATTGKTSTTIENPVAAIEKTGTTTGNPDAATGGTGTAPAVFPSAPDALLAVSGIAHPEPFVRYAHTLCPRATTLAYPDHHAFSHGDLVHIDRAFAALEGQRRVVLTTEKDAARLLHAPGLTPAVRAALYVQPIEVEFLHGGEEKFNDIIYRYVRSYPRNR